MMTNKLIYCLALLLLFACKQQDVANNYPEYFLTFGEAKKAEAAGQLDSAILLFRRAERLVDFIPAQHYVSARGWSYDLGDCAGLEDYYRKAVENGFEYDYFGLPDYPDCPNIDSAFHARLQQIFQATVDMEYKTAVDSMHGIDQAARRSGNRAALRGIDSTNLATLSRYIEERGFPSDRKVGSMTALKAITLLLHFDLDEDNKILGPILDRALRAGYLPPADYAHIVDRRLAWGPKQAEPYYYQLPSDKFFEMTAAEIAEIDQRRASIGLGPVADMKVTQNPDGSVTTWHDF